MRRRTLGFTQIELVVVITIMAILTVTALPQISRLQAMRMDGYRDDVLAALRHAQAVARGHRRLVCVNLTNASEWVLTQAGSAGAGACDPGLPLNSSNSGQSGYYLGSPPGGASVVLQPNALYFQPNGTVTSSASSADLVNASVTLTDVATISVLKYGWIE